MLFDEDYRRSKAFYPQLREIIRQQVSVEEASQEMDLKQATDMVVMQTPKRAVACRVRNEGYANFNDVTMRYSRPSGTPTEYQKIISGWADWSIYAHSKAKDLIKWVLYDLHKFRALLQFYPLEELREPGRFRQILRPLAEVIPNKDGSSELLVLDIFGIEKMWSGLIIAQNGYTAAKTGKHQNQLGV